MVGAVEVFHPAGCDDSLLDGTQGGRRAAANHKSPAVEVFLDDKVFGSQRIILPGDEIDVGVSGSVADKMGRMIVGMGDSMQVIAITHLPQVASKGNAHYLVYKEIGDDRVASSKIRKIEGEERAREIARMLSGQEVTPEALANARVLLGQ